jgi:hypothetical protein
MERDKYYLYLFPLHLAMHVHRRSTSGTHRVTVIKFASVLLSWCYLLVVTMECTYIIQKLESSRCTDAHDNFNMSLNPTFPYALTIHFYVNSFIFSLKTLAGITAFHTKGLKMPKGQSIVVNQRRTDSTFSHIHIGDMTIMLYLSCYTHVIC